VSLGGDAGAVAELLLGRVPELIASSVLALRTPEMRVVYQRFQEDIGSRR
jgi:hypothetical protein